MKSRKYMKDYKLVHAIRPNGSIATCAEYTGKYYRFTADSNRINHARKLSVIFIALSWATYLIALLPAAYVSRVIYVIVPFVSTAIPLVFLSDSVLIFLRAKAPLKRETADRISQGLPARSMIALIFASFSFLSFAVTAVLSHGDMRFGDIAFGVSSLCLCAFVAFIFRLKKDVRTALLD